MLSVNPFKPNEISHRNHLEQYISVLSDVKTGLYICTCVVLFGKFNNKERGVWSGSALFVYGPQQGR